MKKLVIAMMIVSTLVIVGCSTHVHTVGAGPQTGQVTSERQWWILFGLIPLNSVDVGAMAGGATDYEIQTQMAPTDIVLNIFTQYVTVNSRTVTVTK
jgi:hypothetical protein